ncbi:cyclase family protein [Pedococcus sp. 5OH_020]|uniref:cyclase family protein n=1 Tax=Pedococcus sp. 5OH_020 TaxID=2989814 RepID=UPI0022E9C26F|nr:cyclase family protein [Pedococcus sp. 5OH_020]
MSFDAAAAPRYDELARTTTGPAGAAWGVFGNDVGTLNFMTPQALVRAAGEVRRGVTFSLNLATTEPDPPILGRGALDHHRVALDGGGFDDYYDAFFPQASSQWDALSHVEHPLHGFYQGYDVAAVTHRTHPALGIDQWATRGIAGRFVLADVWGHLERQGTPLDPASPYGITADALDEVIASQGSSVEPGDVLLVNTGWLAWYRRLPTAKREELSAAGLFAAPGLDPDESTARWLWDHRVAAVAADCPALERMPFDKSHDDGFLHLRLIPKLGYAVGELFDLEALAADCAVDGRYQGLFCSAPINTPGGAGSPANALAIK